MWNLKNTPKPNLENRLVVTRGGRVGEMGEGKQKVKTSRYKINVIGV